MRIHLGNEKDLTLIVNVLINSVRRIHARETNARFLLISAHKNVPIFLRTNLPLA